MASQELIELRNQADSQIKASGITEELAHIYCQIAEAAFQTEKDKGFCLETSRRAKEHINSLAKMILDGNGDIWTLERISQDNHAEYGLVNKYYDMLKLESYDCFESFIFYMERKRPYQKRFYQPRMKTLKIVVDDLQDLEDGVITFYGLSMPSRVGKSTICIFFLAWVAMRKPDSHNAMGGHSGHLAKRFFKGLMNLFTTSEYTFEELFAHWNPGLPVLQEKSADEFTINLGNPDEFSTITCRGIDGTWTGAIDVSEDGYLYVDDLVRDRQHSLSTVRMNETYQEYLNKMVDRKNDGAKELMVGTLWNVLDPLERIRNEYSGNPDYRFRRIPALNENEESNFAYEVKGFSTKYYLDMRDRLDNAEWMAKFMQQPYVREGLLFPVDELEYFEGILPPGDFRVVAAVDVAWGGGDSLSMPIGAEYDNGDVYIFDWVFNKGAKEVTLPLVTGQIINNQIRQIRFEGNTGGELYCKYVDEMLQKQGWKCSCTHRKAPNKMDKMAKIIAYSGDVKRKFKFLSSRRLTDEEKRRDEELGIIRHTRSQEYQAAMDEFTNFVTIGKNDHEDAADGITQLEMFIDNPSGLGATVEAIQNPFRTGTGGYGYYGY